MSWAATGAPVQSTRTPSSPRSNTGRAKVLLASYVQRRTRMGTKGGRTLRLGAVVDSQGQGRKVPANPHRHGLRGDSSFQSGGNALGKPRVGQPGPPRMPMLPWDPPLMSPAKNGVNASSVALTTDEAWSKPPAAGPGVPAAVWPQDVG